MATISNTPRPGYVWDATDNCWYPIGTGPHSHADYITAGSAINPNIVDAKGDLIAATAADTVARLAVGANNTVLTADSSTATGLKWATPTASTPANAVSIIDTSESTTSTTFTDLATVGPSVTLTTGTRALVTITSYSHNSINSTSNFIGFEVSGATSISADSTRSLFCAFTSTGNSRPELRNSYSYILTGLNAGSNTFTLKYRCSSGTLTAQNRILSVVDMGS